MHADFSEIDTSAVGSDANLNTLASFDLADIIGEEHSLSNTDYINNNFEEKEKANEERNSKKNLKKVQVEEQNCFTTSSGDQAQNEEGGNANSSHPIKNVHKPVTKTNQSRIKRRYPCIVCKKKFAEKSKMKDHVKSTHLRHVSLCNVCGKRMFHDKLVKHEEMFHSQHV